MIAWVLVGVSGLAWFAAYGQRLIASRRHREALATLDKAEAVLHLAMRYQQDGDQAHEDAQRFIGDALAQMREWAA